ncbi:MAG: hypothetical protein KDA92_02280, partial [Planctomycetales bacterium]|nr:hypothetical protein [Planctomycetales bacterium]
FFSRMTYKLLEANRQFQASTQRPLTTPCYITAARATSRHTASSDLPHRITRNANDSALPVPHDTAMQSSGMAARGSLHLHTNQPGY